MGPWVHWPASLAYMVSSRTVRDFWAPHILVHTEGISTPIRAHTCTHIHTLIPSILPYLAHPLTLVGRSQQKSGYGGREQRHAHTSLSSVMCDQAGARRGQSWIWVTGHTFSSHSSLCLPGKLCLCSHGNNETFAKALSGCNIPPSPGSNGRNRQGDFVPGKPLGL